MIRRAETSADVEAHSACSSAVWPEDVVSVDFVLDRTAREPERLYLNALEGERVIGTGFVDRSSRRGFRPVAITVLRSGAGGAAWAARSSTAASSTRDRFVIWRKPPAAAQPTLGSLQRLCDAAAAVAAKPATLSPSRAITARRSCSISEPSPLPLRRHKANDAMRRVNEKLRYRPRPALLDVSRPPGP